MFDESPSFSHQPVNPRLLRSFISRNILVEHPLSVLLTMPSLGKCCILFFLALPASALTTPHVVRHANHHRAVAPAMAASVEESVVVPQDNLAARTVRRRSNSARCKAKPSGATPAVSVPPVGASPSVTSPSNSPKAAQTSSSNKPVPSTGGGGVSGGHVGQGMTVFPKCLGAWPDFLWRYLLRNWTGRLWHHQQRWPAHRCSVPSTV